MIASNIDIDLRTILGYLSDDRSQILPKGMGYRHIRVTYLSRATAADLPEAARKGLEEIRTKHTSDGKFDYMGFTAAGTRYFAEHPEYVDELIQKMQLNGVRDQDESH